jgi:hypothetical protein
MIADYIKLESVHQKFFPKQSHLDHFFAGHNDPSEFGSTNQTYKTASPSKRTISTMLPSKPPVQEDPNKPKASANKTLRKMDKESEEDASSDFERVSNTSECSQHTEKSSDKEKVMEPDKDSEDSDKSEASDFSKAEVTKVIPGKKKVSTDTKDDDSIKLLGGDNGTAQEERKPTETKEAGK